MPDYIPPFSITNNMLETVASISEKIGKITSTKELETKPHLRRNNKIRSIHSSLKIEANSLSLSDVRDIINGQLVIGNQKEIQEIKNAYNAYEQIEKINPFSIDSLKKIHGIMTHLTVNESGDFRKGDEGVFSGNKCIFMAPPASMVPQLIESLFKWMKENRNKIHPLILSAVFHYEFVFIHPFSDGNGRMARLWHTALLYKWKNIFEFIPLESQIEKFQAQYYKAIGDSNASGNSNPFIQFSLDMIDKTLDEVISQIERTDYETSEYVKKLLNVMEFSVPYTGLDIMNALNLKSRETFRKNYLHPAIELGAVRMTLPDKPNSKNQRYVKC